MDGLVGLGADAPRADAVAALDLVRVGELFAGEHAGVGAQTLGLVAQPAVLEPGEQRVAVRDELCRVGRLRCVDLLLQLRRAVVRVDEPVDVPPEPQAEEDVVLGLAHAYAARSNSAAWPWPTPTHIVATP